MTRGAALLIAALFLLLACGKASAAGHVYINGIDGGVGSTWPALSIGASTPAVLVPARPGQQRYEMTFVCTVAVNVAWGTAAFGAASPAPTTSTGIPVAANTPWIENIDGTTRQSNTTTENWDRELDVISQAGSGSCVTYEATLN